MLFASFVSFWLVSLSLALVPGADWAYAISAGLEGRAKAVAAVLGLVCGCMLAAMVVAAGIGAVVARHPAVLQGMTYAGAGYLLWLGIRLLRRPAAGIHAESAQPRPTWSWLSKGACVSGLNPKLLLLFLALLPQFVSEKAAWPVTAQIVVLGLAHALNCLLVYMAVGLSSHRVLAARPQAARHVSSLSGAIMVLIALSLAAESVLSSRPG